MDASKQRDNYMEQQDWPALASKYREKNHLFLRNHLKVVLFKLGLESWQLHNMLLLHRNWNVFVSFKGVILCFFFKIIILCIWCNRICCHALMFKKHNFSNTVHYCTLLPYMPHLKCFVFYKVPPSDKYSLLWLANWPSALWLAEHHKQALEI